MEDLLMSLGLPSLIISSILGIVVWWVKRSLDHREAAQQRREEEQERRQAERDKNQQELFLMMMQSTRANAVGIKAIAAAVQRIPDAHCNGDMEAALKVMKEHQEKEKDFLLKQGVSHIFEY